MATIDGVNAPNGNEALGLDQQQNFDQAVENAQVNEIVGEAVVSLAMSQLMDYASDMLKEEG
ncbi:hypothetical protein EI168_01445 [Halomonas sp. FME1]|uniref:Uncharacterized protein n=1 Tax=Halomonas casei TaxID=2742613 RepID=A0ABR9EX28_9GAMM|nr:hypothetical protein [Halomonas casei]MBE0398774.1 hypothetical protein [Halomonas casei]